MFLLVAPGSPISELQGPDRPGEGRARQGQLRDHRRRQRLSPARQMDREPRRRRAWSPVPYRGSVPAFTDVIGGRLDAMIDTATSAIPRIRNGQLRPLAVSSPERYPLMPDTPTMARDRPRHPADVVARDCGRAADAAPDHRSAQRRAAARARAARRQAVAGGNRGAGGALLARGVPAADRNRDRALHQDRGGQRHQGRSRPTTLVPRRRRLHIAILNLFRRPT